MAYQRSDPEVKAWMKDHPKEVEHTERLYEVLKGMEFVGLEELAHDVGVDVSKRWAQFRDNLITDIIKVAPEKALEIVLGQGVLSENEGQGGKSLSEAFRERFEDAAVSEDRLGRMGLRRGNKRGLT